MEVGSDYLLIVLYKTPYAEKERENNGRVFLIELVEVDHPVK